jgi:hypothetical protein
MSGAVAFPWIISRRQDVALLVGGWLAAWALYAAWSIFGIDIVLLWFAWVALVDTPHFVGTYVRAYVDPTEALPSASLRRAEATALSGLAALGLSGLLFLAGIDAYRAPWSVFLAAFSLWAYWHVVMQHFGFVRLYAARAGEGRSTLTHDRAAVQGGLMIPLIGLVLTHPEALGLVGLSQGPDAGRTRLIAALATATVLLAYLVAAAAAWRRGGLLNVPKVFLVVSTLTLHGVVALHPASTAIPLFAFGALVTIYHDLQYLAIVLHQQARRSARSTSPASPAWAWLTAVPARIVMAAVLFGVAARGIGCSLAAHPGCAPLWPSDSVPLFGAFNADALLVAVFLGIPLHHYATDSLLWRFSSDAELRRDFQL